MVCRCVRCSGSRHDHCFLRSPLVSRMHGRATIQVLVAWRELSEAPAPIVELELLAVDGPHWQICGRTACPPKWQLRVPSHQRGVCAGCGGANRDVGKGTARSCDDWSVASASEANAASSCCAPTSRFSHAWTRFLNSKSVDGKAEETAHKGNALLPETGVTPRQVGQSPIIDTLKYTTHRVLRRLTATTNRFVKRGREAQT